MSRMEAGGDWTGEAEQFPRCQMPAGEAVPQRLPLEKLNRKEILAFHFANFVDGADVWVTQGGGGASFAAKAFSGQRVTCKLFGKKLQRDESAKFEILGLVDDTHAPATELFEDPVVRDSPANHCGHALLRMDVSYCAGASQSKGLRYARCRKCV